MSSYTSLVLLFPGDGSGSNLGSETLPQSCFKTLKYYFSTEMRLLALKLVFGEVEFEEAGTKLEPRFEPFRELTTQSAPEEGRLILLHPHRHTHARQNSAPSALGPCSIHLLVSLPISAGSIASWC